MEKKSLSQQTADRLYNMIVAERRMEPGEKLPNEVELARELGVSRTTLREALHALTSRNILEDQCIRAGRDRTRADREFHAAIVRATHNEFMMRLLPMINQAVEAAVVSGEHRDQLAEDTRRDHALIMDFFQKRDAAGAEHAMAIHMHHSIDVMGLK